MSAFHNSLNRNRRLALLLNALVVASLLFSSYSSVAAQDGTTPEPTAPPQEETLLTPEPTLEPSEEPTAEPSIEPTTEPTLEPTAEPTAPLAEPPGEGEAVVEGIMPANDLVADAIRMYLDTEYFMNTIGATVGAEDVENVCSFGDTGSVWYKFTPATSGVYEFSAAGSDYSPNISVLRYVSSTSRTPVVCNRPQLAFDGYYKLAFYASAGVTYLVRVSDDMGGNLKLQVTRKTCPSGYLCGAAIGGDGQTIHDPDVRVLDSGGNVRASGRGELSGFIAMKLQEGISGKFTVVTYGRSLERSLIVNTSVTLPGLYKPSAIGLPMFRVYMVDKLGNPTDMNRMTITAANNHNLGGEFEIGDDWAKVYAPTGIYNLGAMSLSSSLIVYKPDVMLASSDVPYSVLLDPAGLDRAEFTFNPHSVDVTYGYFNIGSNISLRWNFTTSSTFTCAAPAGTQVKSIKMEVEKEDTSVPEDDYYYFYSVLDSGLPIYDGDVHTYNFGGTFTHEIESDAPIYRLDESGGTITPALQDAYGNDIYDLLRYTSGTLSNVVPAFELYRYGDATWHDWFAPQKLTDPWYFTIDDTDPEGDWRVSSAINVGPYGGILTDDVIFGVYPRSTGSLEYDEFANALDVSGETAVGPIKTLYYTTASYDPLIPALGSKGYASAWFKYIPAESGYLKLDTAGSDYITVLNVWQGAPGTFKNRAFNAGNGYFPAMAGLSVTAGQTYYIEVTQYDLAPRDAGVQSLEEGEVTIEQIGGSLYLNLEWLPCYSVGVSASPATGGTVTKSPAPNCLGTKYSKGTIVTLTAAPKTGYDMWHWVTETGFSDENPFFQLVNNQDIMLEASFKPVPGKPALKSPAASALVHRQEDLTFSWYESVPLATTYELELSTDPAFSGGTVHLWPGLSTTSYTIAAPFFSENTTYYWRVRGVSGIGQTGAWSLTRSLRVAVPPPIQLHVYSDSMDFIFGSPDDALTTAGPWFHWWSVEGATSYTLQISHKPDWSSLVGTYTISGGRNTFLYNANLPAGIQYSWRVRANASRGPSRWAEGVPFIVPQAPPVPAPVSPASNALTTDYTPLFKWSDVVPAPGQPELDFYEIEIEIPNANNTFLTIQDSRSIIRALQFEFTESLPANKSYYWHVRSCNVIHNCSAWSAGRKLRTAVAPPTLITPANGTTTQTNRPTFTWNSVNGASGYTVQISRNDSFSAIVTSGTLSGAEKTSFTPALNLPVTDAAHPLWWRVRANSPTNGPSSWSEIWNFIVPPSPPIPVMVSPANTALITIPDPMLEWNDVVPAAGTPELSGYFVQFSENMTFSGAPEQWTFVSNYHLPELQPNRTYYWRVRSQNVDTNLSGWSVTRSFRTAIKVPEPYGVYDEFYDPNGGDDPATNRPEIRWSAVPNASSFTIQLSRYANFSSLLTSATVSTNVFYTNVTLPAGVLIYYRVRANAASGSFGPSGWMTPTPFTAPSALPIPVPQSPANSAIVKDSTVRLDWADVVMPVGKTLYSYILEIDEDPGFHSPPDEYILDAGVSFKDVPLVPTHTYYWRVRSNDTAGYLSGWSAVRSVRVAVAAPVLLGPMYAGVINLRPPFIWDPVEGASGYTLQIARNSTFTSLVGTYTRTAAQTDYTPTVNLPAYTVLYWRVRANSPTHGPGNWSGAWFTTPNPPSTPTLLSPANGAVLADHNPLLDWSTSTLPAGTEFDHYRLQVCYDIECSAVVYDTEVHTLANSSYDFGATSLDAGVYYYWRVRAENRAGAISAWSAVRMFRTSPAP